ncbi:MAG: MFS transporter [Candidatus Rokubacteria bacterium]|nr:MFS transporter [Candidatus Rokubacteria bacterium]
MNRRWVLPAAMFSGTVAWSFVSVSLPFHVRAISDVDPVATLRWTGWILGVTALTTVLTAPFWGMIGDRYDPRRLYVVIEVLQGIGFLAMAIARTLLELFGARLVLGFWGAASTFSFIIAGREADPAETRRQVSRMQASMMVGQVLGPLFGAMAAAQMGFRLSFVLAGLVLFATAAFVQLGVPPLPPARAADARRAARAPVSVVGVTAIVLGGSIQIMFLPAVLPELLEGLGVEPARTLEAGGIVLFVSGIAAAVGSLAAPRLAEALPERQLIPLLLGGSSVFLVAFSLAGSVWSFGALRFLQVLCVAPVFPIVVARIAHRVGGKAIGFINSARIGAAFIGPVVATTLLAWGPAPVLYVCLALMTLACAPLAWRGDGRAGAAA